MNTQDIKLARLFGHPIHSMLVHFPSALWPTSLAFDVLGYFLNNQSLALVAFYVLGAGIIGALAAATFGAYDFYQLPPTHKAWRTAATHAGLNILWIFWFVVLFGLRTHQYPQINLITVPELVFSCIGILGLIVSNYLGGNLIFHYRIGVNPRNC